MKIGTVMKIRNLTGIAAVIILSIYFVSAGLAGSQSTIDTEKIIIEKAHPIKTIQDNLGHGDSNEQDRSIFSKTTIISLLAAVIGIVAFRRNTYS